MGNRGFVAFMEYDHHTNRFITSSSYLKTSATEIAYPDFQGRIPDSELSFVAETQQDHYMGTLNIDDTSYIYSIDHVMKSSIGDAELDIFHPKAVYVFGLPSTAIKSTVMHLLVWHLPVIAFIVIMSAVAVYLLSRRAFPPLLSY
ncbi:hypothetical protein BVRB_035400 [Beta vulgaris subsp. vulgaris]|uniref:Uncharacterized protein n=1 Tax=Beta vulgaris subsp. vulgaris TaxID=3555 RepID=A0A0J7YPN4_BETVV|nr:hypothetical protein BVRB_035400 [Beta vulgaris subsp. vulgaris]